MINKNYQEKELEILRNAIDKANNIVGRKLVQSDEIKNMINILEEFLRKNKTLCYGGTAINNILPEQDRFYNKDLEIPDYDFFSPNPIDCAKKLSDIYNKEGYIEVEAKSGVHSGTYKVFVNYIPIADITFLDKTIFNNLYKKSIKINAINYCPPNFLRMAMYQELSRPMGDVTRWEKVLKRSILLNKNYPLVGTNCSNNNFMRDYTNNNDDYLNIFSITRQCFINQGLVFFGGYATSLYSKYMPKYERKLISNMPDFDVLSDDPYTSCVILKEQLQYEGIKNINIIKKKPIGEYINEHYQISIGNETIAFIYKPTACHSYNIINIDNQNIKVATIDTMLSFYLIFIYADKEYYDINRILCISEYLFKVQLKNRLKQKGLLKRFSVTCYGKQKTLEEIKSDKGKIIKDLQENKISKKSHEYIVNFFRYIPSGNNNKSIKNNKSKKNNKSIKNNKSKKK